MNWKMSFSSVSHFHSNIVYFTVAFIIQHQQRMVYLFFRRICIYSNSFCSFICANKFFLFGSFVKSVARIKAIKREQASRNIVRLNLCIVWTFFRRGWTHVSRIKSSQYQIVKCKNEKRKRSILTCARGGIKSCEYVIVRITIGREKKTTSVHIRQIMMIHNLWVYVVLLTT